MFHKLPPLLDRALENVAKDLKAESLRSSLSQIYGGYQRGIPLSRIESDMDAVTYSLYRMPATYAALKDVLDRLPIICLEHLHSWTDLGAGTGALQWALYEKNLSLKVTCIENNPYMMKIGAHLQAYLSMKAEWVQGNILTCSIQPASAFSCSYVLNELSLEDARALAMKVYEAADQMVFFVEPGTPAAYKRLLDIRSHLQEKGAQTLFPCTHDAPCPLIEGDWCHFPVRHGRSQAGRHLMKHAPGEQEKYTALVMVKRTNYTRGGLRVVRKPRAGHHKILLDLCDKHGIQEKLLTKKHPFYKKGRSLEWGDKLEDEAYDA